LLHKETTSLLNHARAFHCSSPLNPLKSCPILNIRLDLLSPQLMPSTAIHSVIMLKFAGPVLLSSS
jgi:hypothetical protein